MARTYDRLIRFYDSWFGDLLDPEKEFTPEECWQIVLAIRECQREATLEPLAALPKHLRRGLQMRTLETQILKILEHTGKMKERGAAGGAAAAKARAEANQVAAELRQKENQELHDRLDEQAKNAISREQYLLWVKNGVIDRMGNPGPNWEKRLQFIAPRSQSKPNPIQIATGS